MGYIIDKAARCSVIGHGSWATALVKILLENENSVGWYIRNGEVAAHVKEHQTNPKYLSSVHFNLQKLEIYDNLNEVVENSDVLVLAAPSAFLKTVLEPLTVSLKEKIVISAIKGIVPDEYVTIAEYCALYSVGACGTGRYPT